ncbi:MAG: hypothetical protein JW782_07740 [Candidatus Saganbacteria bacterium]|nr:hypothetical protein [Candidatus Saganbacteria bacterium]
MKRALLSSLIIVSLASFALAQQVVTTVSGGSDQPTSLQSNIGGISVGYVKVGTKEVANLAWHPDFKIGPWESGFDVNVALGEEKPPEYESVVLRYLGYDDGKKGLRYGVIDNLTWGHGMLISNYSTRVYGPVLLNNEQMAWRGYLDMDSYVVRGLSTRTGVNGVRVEERINPMLTLGQTVIMDSDGIVPAGTTEAQKVTGLGLDATMPLPFNLTGYAEYAQLVGHGGGFSAGLGWAWDIMLASADFYAEYRLLDKGFVPGYFNSDYEYNPVNLASAEASGNVKNGYAAKLGLNAFGFTTASVVYENYNDSDSASITADLFAKLPRDIEVHYYYQQPDFVNFRSLTLEEGAVIGGSIAYPVNPYTKIVYHYKKAYDTSLSQVVESQYYELRLSF